jgi:AsmA protein
MLVDVPPLLDADGQWSRETFDLPDLTGADVDVRLSATHARVSRLSIKDAALSIILRGGRLEIALAEAKAYQGTIKAHATFAAATNSTLDFHATAQTTGIDAGALLWDVSERQDFAGALDSQISLDASGDSVADLMHDLDGRASLSVTQGEITGIDLERALRRLDKRPLASALQFRSGRSSVDKATATLKILKGTATLEEGVAHGPGFALSLSGVTRIAERNLALSVKAVEADGAGAPLTNGQHIDFGLTGPWDEPEFMPDTQALIKRSNAAAPLLPRAPAREPEATLP